MISIVIVSRSNGVYLNTCLQSIIRQQYKDIEVLILHLSENNEQVRVNNFKDSIPRIRNIHIPNTSQINDQLIFELGLKNSFGEYVGFIDERDCLYPTALGSLFGIVNGENPDIVFFIHNRPCSKDFDSNGDKTKLILKINSENIRRFYRRDFAYGNKISEFVLESCVNSHSLHWIATIVAKSISIVPEIGSYSLTNIGKKENDLIVQQLENQYNVVFDYLISNINSSHYKNELLVCWLLHFLELRPLYGDRKLISILIKSKLIKRYTEKEFNKALAELEVGRDKQDLIKEWYSNCRKKAKFPDVFWSLFPSRLSNYMQKNGFRYSMNRGLQQAYHRLPGWVQSILSFTRKNIRRRVSNHEILERLEVLIKQGRFEQYMSIINEDSESKLSKQLAEIKRELVALKKEVH